jgi:hypothetical protein
MSSSLKDTFQTILGAGARDKEMTPPSTSSFYYTHLVTFYDDAMSLFLLGSPLVLRLKSSRPSPLTTCNITEETALLAAKILALSAAIAENNSMLHKKIVTNGDTHHIYKIIDKKFQGPSTRSTRMVTLFLA